MTRYVFRAALAILSMGTAASADETSPSPRCVAEGIIPAALKAYKNTLDRYVLDKRNQILLYNGGIQVTTHR